MAGRHGTAACAGTAAGARLDLPGGEPVTACRPSDGARTSARLGAALSRPRTGVKGQTPYAVRRMIDCAGPAFASRRGN